MEQSLDSVMNRREFFRISTAAIALSCLAGCDSAQEDAITEMESDDADNPLEARHYARWNEISNKIGTGTTCSASLKIHEGSTTNAEASGNNVQAAVIDVEGNQRYLCVIQPNDSIIAWEDHDNASSDKWDRTENAHTFDSDESFVAFVTEKFPLDNGFKIDLE